MGNNSQIMASTDDATTNIAQPQTQPQPQTSAAANLDTTQSQGQKRKRVLNTAFDIMDIVEHQQFRCIEPICVSLRQYPISYVDAFVSTHYIQDVHLKKMIGSILKQELSRSHPMSLSAALLLAIPFVNCSYSVQMTVCHCLVTEWDLHSLHSGLVHALCADVGYVPLSVKLYLSRALCLTLEYQQHAHLSPLIKDSHGQIGCALRILQCPRNVDTYLLKQYAARILIRELGEGVMARQHLRDCQAHLVVLQTAISVHPQHRALSQQSDKQAYADLMMKLLQFLYRTFDFEDFWFSQKECQALSQHSTGKEMEYLMKTRHGFSRLCTHKFREMMGSGLQSNILVDIALKLMLKYPLFGFVGRDSKYRGPDWDDEFERTLIDEQEMKELAVTSPEQWKAFLERLRLNSIRATADWAQMHAPVQPIANGVKTPQMSSNGSSKGSSGSKRRRKTKS